MRLTPEQGRIWEVILKAIAGLLAFSGAIVAVLKYLDDKATNERKYLDDMREIKRKQEEEKATMLRAEAKEAIKDLKAMRQEIYLRLIKSMAKIMNYDPGDDEWKGLKAAFLKSTGESCAGYGIRALRMRPKNTPLPSTFSKVARKS